MDDEDRKDIIAKINSAGDSDNENNDNSNNNNDENGDEDLSQTDSEDFDDIKLESFESLPKEQKPLFVDAKLGVDTIEETLENILINILKEDFDSSGESDIFVDKEDMMTEPLVAPAKPKTEPDRRIKRREKPFTIPVRPAENPNPKAIK